MEPISIIGNVVLQVLKSVLPDTPEDKLKAVELAIRQQLANNAQLRLQTDINKAEASNPNRTWVSWRELIGYTGAFAIMWNYIVQPFVVMVCAVVGHPVDTNVLVQLQVGDLLAIICGMLGISYTPTAIGVVTDKLRKK